MREQKEDVLIFQHILKTAGTTFTSILEKQFSPKERYYTSTNLAEINRSINNRLDSFYELSPAQRARFRLIYGHLNFGIHKYLPHPAVYVTMLRDPIERVLSQYSFESEYINSPVRQDLRGGEMDLKGFVYYYKTANATDNLQTRMISGNWYYGGGRGPCTRELLEKAKRNLRKHFIVGLTERFDESYLLMRRRLGWPNYYYRRKNISKKRLRQEECTPDELEYIRDHNRYDLELYAYAQELFEEQVREAGPEFAAELREFQRVKERYNAKRKSIAAQLQHHKQGYLQILRSFSVRMFLRKQLKVATEIVRNAS